MSTYFKSFNKNRMTTRKMYDKCLGKFSLKDINLNQMIVSTEFNMPVEMTRNKRIEINHTSYISAF